MNLVPARLACACLVLSASLAHAAPDRSSSAGHGSSSSHHGRLVTVLPDGTLREPSTDRAQATAGTDVLDAGDWSWEIGASGSAASIDGSTTGSLSLFEPSVHRGYWDGLELGIEGEGWMDTRVEQGSPPPVRSGPSGPAGSRP